MNEYLNFPGKELNVSSLFFLRNIYIYTYIVIHRQAVSLYHNSSAWLDTQDASSWDRNTPNPTLDMVSNRSAISVTYVSRGIVIHIY